MTDFEHIEQYDSIDLALRYVSGLLTEEEAGELLLRLRSDKELLLLLQKNIVSDLWLRELFCPAQVRFGQSENNVGLDDCQVDVLPEEVVLFLSQPQDQTILVAPGNLDESFALTDFAEPESPILPFDATIRLNRGTEPTIWQKCFTPIEKPEKVAAHTVGGELKSVSPVSRFKKSNLFFWFRVCLFFGAILWLSSDIRRPDYSSVEMFSPMAVVTETVDAQWGANSPVAKRGQQVGTEEYFLRSGTVRLRYANGTQVILQGPVHYSSQSEQAGFCVEGNLSVYVPPAAVGFEINTTFAKFIDRGTAFAVSVTPDGARADVIEGRVDVGYLPKERDNTDVKSSATLPLVSLSMNEAITIDKKLDAKRDVAQPSRFIDSKRFDRMVDDYIERCGIAKSERHANLGVRPDLLTSFELTDPSKSPVNMATKTRESCPSLSLFSCRETEGRHPGSRAVTFGRRQAYGDFSLPGKYKNMTLVVSARVDRLTNIGNVLLVSEYYLYRPGAPLWQLSQDGRLIVNVSGASTKDTLSSKSDPCFKRNDCGTWCTFAVVLDRAAQTISHYKDGRLVSSTTWSQPEEIQWGKTMLGNHILRDETASARYIDGAIDELIMFDRALSAAEIAELNL